jgi:aspartate-semialdehyde dehydrogenase
LQALVLRGVSEGFRIAVVGATGAVGQEFLSIFEQRNFPIQSLKLLASARSVGKQMVFRGQSLAIEEATPAQFQNVDLAFFSAGASRSRDLAPAAMEAGAIVIDNSSAFRMNPDVPLCVPEVQFGAEYVTKRLFSVPNCTAILLCVAIAPLRSLGVIKRLIVSTYQSASGGGAAVMQELIDQTRLVLQGQQPEPQVLPHPYAFNLFSHNTAINDLGQNEEEAKVIQETRRILGLPDLGINVTCVRVPVLRAHSESVTVEFDAAAPSVDEVRYTLSRAPGLQLVDDRDSNTFPMPLAATGKDDVLVGRLRHDPSNPNAICLFLAGDQLRKGAALNAVQIAEHLISIGNPVETMA